MVYLWRAVDAEGEVLDVLVQSMRNKRAALKLMRKLLKKYAFAPERLVTDDLRSYSAAARELGIERRHERGQWRTIELRIRISRRGGGNARCSGSRARGQPRNFFPRTPPFTTPSMFNAISSQLKHIAYFALTRWPRGGSRSRRPDNSRGADPARSRHGNVTKPARPAIAARWPSASLALLALERTPTAHTRRADPEPLAYRTVR